MSYTNPTLIINLLECRIGSYTTQYTTQCKIIKKIVASPPLDVELHLYHRIILRGNRTSAFLRQDKYFDTLGQLGCGSYGKVELVRSKENNKFYALKSIKGRKTDVMQQIHLLALVERDCAVLLNSGHFVKLKAAWLELNSRENDPDCFKFLWENMPYGDCDQFIKQLHPMTGRADNFSRRDYNKSFFAFHEGTYRSMTQGVDFETAFRSDQFLLRCLYSQNRMVNEGGKKQQYTHIIFDYLMQLIDAVKFLHDKHIRHHDLKPANILISEDLKLKIGDLGLATGFAPQHIPQTHFWTNPMWLTSGSRIDRSLILGGAQEHSQYYQSLVSAKEELRPIGSFAWQPPETYKDFYRTENASGTLFNSRVHRKGDWFAVGVIGFQLLTGLHPVLHSLDIYGDETFDELCEEPYMTKMLMILVSPQLYNPLLYRGQGIISTAFDELFIDKRIHSICVRLMEPDPNKRLDYSGVMNDPNYHLLVGELGYPHSKVPFAWNEFLREPEVTKFETLVTRNERQGKIPGDKLRKSMQIARLPGFPLMTYSPGTIASPDREGDTSQRGDVASTSRAAMYGASPGPKYPAYAIPIPMRGTATSVIRFRPRFSPESTRRGMRTTYFLRNLKK